MNKIFENFLAPAILLALIALIVQGVMAAFEIYNHVRSRRFAYELNQLEYATALLALVDGLPIDEGRRVLLKWDIIDEFIPDRIPTSLHKLRPPHR